MTSRERIWKALHHEEPDRVPIDDGPWRTTIERWRREGLPEGQSPAQYFGYEFVKFGVDNSFRFPEETIEETDDYIIKRDKWGMLKKDWKQGTSTPQLLDFKIKSRDEWEEYKKLLVPSKERFNLDHIKQAYKNAREQGKFVCISGVPGYEAAWRKVGPERLLMLMIEDPEWVMDMYEVDTNLIISLVQILLDEGIEADGGFFYDDLGYKNGLLFSPKHYREQLKPFHKKLCDFFHERGLPIILHSCGNVKELIPDLIEAGWDCLQPLEAKAGLDVRELKPLYGDRLAFMGNIDVRKMAEAENNPDIIEEEIRTKFEVAKRNGGYIYYSDHSVPDNVSFKSYCITMEFVRKYGSYE